MTDNSRSLGPQSVAILQQALRKEAGTSQVTPRGRNPKHVLHVIDRLARGGAERMLVDLANIASADGWRVSVCITRQGGELVSELAREIQLLELGRSRRLDWPAMRRLAAFVRDRKVDVLHVHGRSSFSMVALMKACGLVSHPIILHDHFSIEIDDSIPMWFKLVGRHMLDHYVGVYESLFTWACSAGVCPERVHVIGNALDLRRLASGATIPAASLPHSLPPHPVGVAVGGIRPEKGTDTLLRALAMVPRDRAFSVFVIGGMADPDFGLRCTQLCTKLGINDRVMFLGQRSDVLELLQIADFAIMPSRSESGPLVLIEYMAFGLPFVSTRIGEVSNKAERLGLPEFVSPDDPSALARAMVRLLDLPEAVRRRRGEQGREVVRRHFDLRTVMRKWYGLYHSCCHSR